jgi:hypothetical protein
MHLTRTTIPFVAALACIVGSAALRADEERVPLDKLPRAVSESVKKRFPAAQLTKASKETENGKTEYEVVIKDGGAKVDVIVDPEGSITAIERSIAISKLPGAVRATLDGKYKGATYKAAEEVIKVNGTKETLDCYEVVLTKSDKKRVEVQVSPDGQLKKEENQGEEK